MRNIYFLFFLFTCIPVNAQYSVQNAHSHNDYRNKVPFWTAYNARFGSIEVDVFAVDGELFVAHTKCGVKRKRTLDDLYIKPLLLCYEENQNKPWSDYDGELQLLIELKTPASPTLDLLVAKLAQYPKIFDRSVNPNAVQVVITGRRPHPSNFGLYPSFIMFDGHLFTAYTAEQLERIALYSDAWKMPKNRTLSAADHAKMKEMIDRAHKLNKKIRFWATKDTPKAWKMLMELGVDFINTDKVNKLAEYLQ